jgi:hypothetical protein
VIVLRANGENPGDVDVIELLRGAGALFELLALGLIDSRERDQLQQDRFMRAGVGGLIINRRPGPADWCSVLIIADPIVVEKSVFHKLLPDPARHRASRIARPEDRFRFGPCRAFNRSLQPAEGLAVPIL